MPYHFYKLTGYEATLVTYYYAIDKGRAGGPLKIPKTNSEEIKRDYPFLESEVPGLKMHFLENKGRERVYEKAVLAYLSANAKQIDILNLFHFGSETIFYALYYKWKNPKGKVYLKLDIDISFYKTQKSFINTANKIPVLGTWIEKLIFSLFFKQVALISAESSAGLQYFKDRFNISSNKLALIPNGIDADRILALIGKVNSFEEKENIILTVGRIGNPQKNTMFLMEAVAQIDLKDWKLYLVGPIENGFKMEIEDYFKRYPQLIDKVIFTGAINDPKELYWYYNKAKVFCLPSLWEGFPLVACEALFFGCYPVLSKNIYAASDFCNDGQTGLIFDPAHNQDLISVFNNIISGNSDIGMKYKAIVKLSNENYVWSNIIRKLLLHFNIKSV